MKTRNEFNKWLVASALFVCIALAAWAVSPHYECVGKTDLSQCDDNCNGQCTVYSYSGTCNTCVSSPEDGTNECTPATNPTYKSVQYKRGQCNLIEDVYGHQWETCYCKPDGNQWSNGSKRCDGC